jgi:hypothetical protein
METSYMRLQKRIEILNAAIDLQADPDNALKRAKLSALLEPDLSDAFAKAAGRPAPVNLIPLLLKAREEAKKSG